MLYKLNNKILALIEISSDLIFFVSACCVRLGLSKGERLSASELTNEFGFGIKF